MECQSVLDKQKERSKFSDESLIFEDLSPSVHAEYDGVPFLMLAL